MGAGARRSRRANAVLATAALLTVAAVGTVTILVIRTGHTSSPDVEVRGALGVGTSGLDERAPAFTLPTLTGDRALSLSDLAGKTVVLNFWRSDCTPCRDEFAVLANTYQHRKSNTIVVGIATDSIPQDARDFVHAQDAEWPQALDKNLEVSHAYRVAALPQTFFIRADGSIAWRVFGRLDDQHVARGLRAARR